VQRGRDALSAIGASQQIIDKFLPGYKSVVGKGTETASPLTAVMEPEALRAKGLGAGSTFVDPQTGQTVRLTEQDGKLMKSYVTPAKDITAEYMPSGIEGAKVKKIYADIDRTEAAIKDIDSKIKMRPEEMKLKTQQVFAKISNDQLRAKIAKESLGIRYAGLALRRDLAELAREDAKRKLGINTSFRMADFNRKIQATAAANVGRAEASLLNAKETLAKATTEGKPNERQAAQEAINFLEGEVATLRRAASGGIDYNSFRQSMDSIGLGDVDIDMSMFGSTSPMQSYGYQGYPQQQQAPVIVMPGGGAPAPYPYPYPPSPYPAPAPAPAPGGGTTAGSAVFRLSDGSVIPIGPDGFHVGQQPGQVSNKANALVKIMSGGKK
jgi:hypothetical protein